MTAQLVHWNNEPMPDAVTIAPAVESTFYAAPARLVAMEQRARDGLAGIIQGATTLVEALAELRAVNAHTVRGFDLWHEYVEDLLGDQLRQVKFTNGAVAMGERRALVQSMRATHPATPMRTVAERLGVSLGTVMADVGEPRGRVLEIEPAEGVELPAPTGSLYDQAHEWLRRQGDRGLTIRELMAESGWEWQRASGTLSRLHHKKRRAVPSGAFRQGLSAYVAIPEEDQ